MRKWALNEVGQLIKRAAGLNLVMQQNPLKDAGEHIQWQERKNIIGREPQVF